MSKREELADLLARQNGYTSLLAIPDYMRDWWFKRADEVMSLLNGGNDEWIDWGGIQPADSDAKVMVKLRNGCIYEGAVYMWDWEHDGSSSDITAYRVVK